jgi:hypothetical protein
MNEKLIERKLREGVKKRGGLAVKFTSPFFTGMPDRFILTPGGRIRFAELKSTGKQLSERQEVVKKQLEDLGFSVAVIDDQKTLDEFLKSL